MEPLSALLASLPAGSPLPFELNARRCLRLDLSGDNPATAAPGPTDVGRFNDWIKTQIGAAGADYAAGGYAEDRPLYRASAAFATDSQEPRTLHLGVDIWIAAGTPLHAALPGVVHSTADNAATGDYGPTVILEHEYGDRRFFTLYGHLARRTLARIHPGQSVRQGELIGWLGESQENGGWPPHLHFQIINDMGGRKGDHPGVCKPSEKARWLEICPDPNLLLRISALNRQ